MNKPDDIPQDIAAAVLRILSPSRTSLLGVEIAAALIAEREACAVAAAKSLVGYRPVGIDPALWPDPACAIRKRGD